MNEIFEKIYNDNNTDLNESSALFEKVYTEAEMLNEMNPKLRALLAAGLIGTASLGAASCSMPTDDPTIYEQPAPETTNPDNPGDTENPENPNPDDPGDNGGGQETVTFESLGVADYAESLARAINKGSAKQIADTPFDDFVYDVGEHKFVLALFDDGDYIGPEVDDCIFYVDTLGGKTFYVPTSMESDFEAAIDAYNNAQ